jgi:hypothetical protein
MDAEVFSDVDAAFEAGDYDTAQSLMDDWQEKNPARVGKDDMFEGPNQPKKKRRNQDASRPREGLRRYSRRQLLDRIRLGRPERYERSAGNRK